MRTLFPTRELRDEAVDKYHAIEGGQQTLSNLAAYVTEVVRTGVEGSMAGKVFFSVSDDPGRFHRPGGQRTTRTEERWIAQWMELQQWVFQQRFFRENLKLGDGGETGADNRILEETFERTGVSIMGKRMFDGGERHWPEEAPFHTPVFVLTTQVREPWERPGGTTFHFVNDGIESRAAAGPRGRRRQGHPDRGRRQRHPPVPERGPGRRVLDRALTGAVRLRSPPVRGSGTRAAWPSSRSARSRRSG